MRQLTESEIRQLEARGNTSDDWGSVYVEETPSGVCGTRLNHVWLGRDVRIINCGLIEDYAIEDEAELIGCSLLRDRRRLGDSRFGVGTTVQCVNEAGGREVKLSRSLTSNIAYVVAMHGYVPGLRGAYETLVAREVERLCEERPRVGAGSRLTHCGPIEGVTIGPGAALSGVGELLDGTVESTPEQPTHVGSGVTARHFIAAGGADMDTGATVLNSYVGENARVADHMLVDNCLVFAKCQLLSGEAVSAFCGPFTVSHHRSTLLIAGLYSFFNAGSATNASNHQYRLGPTQQAVFDRGVKTGSGSYLLQPAHIGPFSMVVGHHKCNPDISHFPFSVLCEKHGESHLIPGQLVRSIGLFRDSRKWKGRDDRRECRDQVSFDVLSPLTADLMMRAIEHIDRLGREDERKGASGQPAGDYIIECGLRIRRSLLERGRRAYELALDSYLCRAYLRDRGQSEGLECEWMDCGGLVCPTFEVRRVEDALVRGAYESVAGLAREFERIAANVRGQLLSWCVGRARSHYGFSERPDDFREAAQRLAEANNELRESLAADAAKEWGERMRVSYALDSDDPNDLLDDFRNVHGDMDDNPDLIDCLNYYD